MKRSLFGIVMFAVACLAQAAPQLSVEQALKIASDALKERNLAGQVWITGLTLEPTSMSKTKFVWVARWSSPVELEAGKRETGLEIQMDGSYARYVDKTSVTPASAGVPADRAALTNHRTRSDRPSILDLKH